MPSTPNIHQKANYLAISAAKYLKRVGFSCPSCGSDKSKVLARKFIVTELRRCENCCLQFRAPTTSNKENESFYQERYKQGFTTGMPSNEELDKLISMLFKGTEKDFSNKIEILRILGAKNGQALFDFGCSWGYGSFQFAKAGFNVEAYEISAPRRDYARVNLGIKVHDSLNSVSNSFDIFFSSHVLEHVPSVPDVINFAKKVLRPGGLFVAFTPNGSAHFRKESPKQWQHLWGEVHPNFLDEHFYRKAFNSYKYLITSTPYDLRALHDWIGESSEVFALTGNELLFVARI